VTEWNPNFHQKDLLENERQVMRGKARWFYYMGTGMRSAKQTPSTVNQEQEQESSTVNREQEQEASNCDQTEQSHQTKEGTEKIHETYVSADNKAKSGPISRPPTQKLCIDPEYLNEKVNPKLNMQRGVLLGKDYRSDKIRRKYMMLDHPYIPVAKLTRIHMVRHKECLRIALERQSVDPAYTAPFDTDSLLETCKANIRVPHIDSKGNAIVREGKPQCKTIIPKYVASGPNTAEKYRNCLLCVRCPCCHSHWCLIHPTGELLSRLMITMLQFPHNDKIPEPKGNNFTVNELEIGEQIRQIEPCDTRKNSTVAVVFAVRTDNYVSIICLKNHQYKESNKKHCSRRYKLTELSRIDLRSLSKYRAGYVPIEIACHGKYGNTLVPPKIALVLRSTSMKDGEINTIAVPKDIGKLSVLPRWARYDRDTDLMNEQDMVLHRVNNLYEISLIEFSSSHPNVLWSAAKSFVRPRFSIFGPHLGHGSSIYNIDLRTNEGIFQWSPSAADHVTEGVHSISAIKTDWDRQHILWVNSRSAGKLWEIDARMPFKAVNCWSLQSMYGDTGITVERFDCHGTGSLILIPDSNLYTNGTTRPTVLVEKNVSSLSLSIHQRACQRPRLGTDSLEISNRPGFECVPVADPNPSIVRSAVFPLPDVAPDVYTCGIGCFRTEATNWLTEEELEGLGYIDTPSKVFGVVTMTNKGDIYSQTFLECNVEEPSQSVPVESGCSPTRILPVENLLAAKKKQIILRYPLRSKMMIFSLPLSKFPPITSQQVVPMAVTGLEQCSPFQTWEGKFLEGRKRQRSNEDTDMIPSTITTKTEVPFRKSGDDNKLLFASDMLAENDNDLDKLVRIVKSDCKPDAKLPGMPLTNTMEELWKHHENQDNSEDEDIESNLDENSDTS